MDTISKLSCCNACLLAQAMKDCKHCPLNPANITLKPDEKTNPQIIKLLQGAKVS